MQLTANSPNVENCTVSTLIMVYLLSECEPKSAQAIKDGIQQQLGEKVDIKTVYRFIRSFSSQFGQHLQAVPMRSHYRNVPYIGYRIYTDLKIGKCPNVQLSLPFY